MSEEILPGFTCDFVHEGDTCKLIDFLVDENRKLRNEVDNLMDFEHLTSVAVAYAGCDECGEYKQTMLRLFAENAKLRELVTMMYRNMQGVLDMSTDTVWVDDIGTLRDEMDYHMQAMAELGMPPADYERRMRELGIEVE